MIEPTTYYYNPNTGGLTTDLKNTKIKDPEKFDGKCLLKPIDDMMQVLDTPIKLARSPFLSKLNNSVGIAEGQSVRVNDGYVLKVKRQGVEVYGGNNPYDTNAYIRAEQMASALASLLRNACGILNHMGNSEEERSWYTEGIMDVMSYLGIDTSKDFTINGMTYHKDKNGRYESEAAREAQEAYERLKANNRTYLLADEKTKNHTDYVSNYYLETVPESVKTAWQEAMEETNVNPFPDGFASTLTRLSTEQDFMTGGDDNILGDTQESCLAAVNKVLERIENLTGTVSEKYNTFLQQEKTFYTALASKIKG